MSKIKDILHKGLSYFIDDIYITDGNKLSRKYSNDYEVNFYPIGYEKLFESNLFTNFDSYGIPLKKFSTGVVYFYTHIFTYALSSWHLFLLTNDRKYLEILLKVAKYIEDTVDIKNDVATFLNYDIVSKRHTGRPTGAMEQGLGITILCIAFQITREPKYLNLAQKCLKPYLIPIEKGGVMRLLERGGEKFKWYEEFPTSKRHVLNGCLDSIIGPMLLSRFTDNPLVHEVIDTGVESVKRLLPEFDRGFWSNYFISEEEPSYIASMKYHLIHAYQLKYMANHINIPEFEIYSNRFYSYLKNPFYRFRSLVTIINQKRKIKPLNR